MYDISNNKKRRKVEKLLSSYGYRVNYSVFEINTQKSKFNQMIKELKSTASKEDNIRVYILNKDVLKKSFTLFGGDIFDEKELYF
jgi:CRISPR-associated protein Cas2